MLNVISFMVLLHSILVLYIVPYSLRFLKRAIFLTPLSLLTWSSLFKTTVLKLYDHKDQRNICSVTSLNTNKKQLYSAAWYKTTISRNACAVQMM